MQCSSIQNSTISLSSIKEKISELNPRCAHVAKEVFLPLMTAFSTGAAVGVAVATGSVLWTAVALGTTGVIGTLYLSIQVKRLGARMMEARRQCDAFASKLLDRVKACVEYNNKITDKESIFNLVDRVKNEAVYSQKGSDDFRAKFVGAQGAIENQLACAQYLGELAELVGMIHTPTPTTPLCSKVDRPVSEGALAPESALDIDKLLTIKSRAEVLRDYLDKGAKLYVVYPQGGLEKRSGEQQKIYLQELKNYPDNLIDSPLSCGEMDPDKIGATYLFKHKNGQLFSFWIKARQANDPQAESEWAIGVGQVTDLKVLERVNEVMDYVSENDGPDIRKDFAELTKK